MAITKNILVNEDPLNFFFEGGIVVVVVMAFHLDAILSAE